MVTVKSKVFHDAVKKDILHVSQSAPSIMQICDIEHYRYVNK